MRLYEISAVNNAELWYRDCKSIYVSDFGKIRSGLNMIRTIIDSPLISNSNADAMISEILPTLDEFQRQMTIITAPDLFDFSQEDDDELAKLVDDCRHMLDYILEQRRYLKF